MCGIVGIISHEPVNQSLYDALSVLQHRGQDAAGIVTVKGNRLNLRKGNGLVRDVFDTRHMLKLRGRLGIGHVRYPTAGCSSSAESQPFFVNSPYGISLAHNGNLTNCEQVTRDLFVEDLRHINTGSDSEVLLNVFAHELAQAGKLRIDEQDVFNAVRGVHRRCRGAYAAVALITGYGIVGFRDPHGIRPVVYGTRETPRGTEVMIASESVALNVLGFELVRDLEPGEAVFVDNTGKISTQLCADDPQLSPCLFEFVYLARPDSIIDNISVYKARLRMGESLAEKVLRERPDHDIDVIIPIPDTSRTSALQMANRLGLKYREGFIKNRYVGRTFIMPGQVQRQKSVKQKLNAIDLEFRGKNVMLVDDSIVRGTTSQQIIQMAREAGARKVYFASAAPPVRFPNVYGIDMPAAEELIGHGRDEQQIGVEIGADWLVFQEIGDLIEAVRYGNRRITDFDDSVFTGHYVTGDIDQPYLDRIAARRSDKARAVSEGEDEDDDDGGGSGDLGLHNSA